MHLTHLFIYCKSPKIPAKVFLKFFIVSSPSTGTAVSGTSGLASAATSGPFLTDELALLTPDTVLDSEADLVQNKLKLSYLNY
jgi:hypothetical protein